MTKDLAKAWAAEGVQAIMNLTIVPYGNAKRTATGKLSCQHGPTECEGNSWEQCGIVHNPDPVKHVPYYTCIEATNGKPNFASAAETCAKKAGLDFAPIKTCFSGAEGKALQKKYADLTPKNHKYTPWVTFNGDVMPQKGTFLHNLCKAWEKEGGAKPAGCKRLEEAVAPCSADW